MPAVTPAAWMIWPQAGVQGVVKPARSGSASGWLAVKSTREVWIARQIGSFFGRGGPYGEAVRFADESGDVLPAAGRRSDQPVHHRPSLVLVGELVGDLADRTVTGSHAPEMVVGGEPDVAARGVVP